MTLRSKKSNIIREICIHFYTVNRSIEWNAESKNVEIVKIMLDDTKMTECWIKNPMAIQGEQFVLENNNFILIFWHFY